ncbi:unnamed protein product, partial [Rotaria sp. Silwood1]
SDFSVEEKDSISSDVDADNLQSFDYDDNFQSLICNGNLQGVDLIQNLDYDDYVQTPQDDDLMIDALLDWNESEPTIELHIAKYICEANLDKTKTNELLSLVNHVNNQDELPPTSNVKLWNKLNIKFDYVKIQYCTNCMIELVPGCSCSCNKRQQPVLSELIIFSVANEISRVVKNNYDLILKYREEKDNLQDDVIHDAYKQKLE